MNSNQTPIFGLLTDFGFDFAVASMKGVIVQSFPDAQIIDIDHSLKKFSIISGAFIIEKSARYFPADMIFICVVDPGVGSERDMLCVRAGSQWFLGPNNGIFHYLFKNQGVEVYRIKIDSFGEHSRTFHGRDLFTPAALKIARGDRNFLEPLQHNKWILLDVLDQNTVITYVDSFGNIKTNIPITIEPQAHSFVNVLINGQKHSIRWQSIFAEVPFGEPLCYKGSNDTLEIAVNNGSAQVYFNADVGSSVSIELKQ